MISSSPKEIWAFTSEDATQYNRIDLTNGTNAHMPQQMIYANISKKLPSWVILYLAPKGVTLGNGEKIGFPYMLENGKPEFFVYPK
ncbi:Hypothetical protein ETEE_p1089 (plasmid) [Edwardsiella anguillarum ET080813]|uniref:Uncharacterized protein n=1 Tax=Edwardsiella anguillarum ET080813 TaxID=667120 RepID=A0A076LPZ8_9GAMM|nr:Hypothetical protein ETEE_p1089 [Edwardsiella anguillarum ET080813]